MMRSHPGVRTALLAGLALLAACDRKSPAPEPTPTVSVTASAAGEKVSIIRPDVEIEREPTPLAPLDVRIGFDEGGTKLSPAAVAVLEDALASEQMKKGGAITLGGHSDAAGTDAANLTASRKRAEAVRDWLIDHAVAEERISVIAFGEQNPVAPNALPNGEPNEAGRARNRRVDLTIAVPQGTPPADDPSANGTLVDELTVGSEG